MLLLKYPKDKKAVADRIYSELLSDKRNIVLIGMPGSGKSTLGNLIAEMTGRAFIDTDTVIEEITDKHPAEIDYSVIELGTVNLAAEG